MKDRPRRSIALACLVAVTVLGSSEVNTARSRSSERNEVLDWNQVFIDTLIATGTPNSSSQRLGAIVHTAIFDAFNGIERRYTPLFVHDTAPRGASRRAAVSAAAHSALVALFPTRKPQLDDIYEAFLASPAGDDDGEDESSTGGRSRERGIAWGEQVAAAVLAWRAGDGFAGPYPAFTGGTAIGQWRPIPPATSMSAQALAFTSPFVLDNDLQFRPPAPRTMASPTYLQDFNAVKALGRNVGSSRTEDQTRLAPFWEGNASVHWNQAANQLARANGLSMSRCSRLLAMLNVAMADTAFTIWSAKRNYGAMPTEVTWRPFTAITLADQDPNPDTMVDAAWQPLVLTPSHPEYPAGHPAQNGAAATVLLSRFEDAQSFTLTTGATSQTYDSITAARQDGNNARVWGGMHYPSTVTISDATGEAIAQYVTRHAMQRVTRPR